jgi:acyl dehydratase
MANLAALGRLGRLALSRGRTPPASQVLEGEIAPPSATLVRETIRWCGGDPKLWRNELPPHLFPQWAFPLLTRALEQVPYPLERVLNQGCRLVIEGPIPVGERLHVTADVHEIREDERKARIHQRVTTGPVGGPIALRADVYEVVPLPKKDGVEAAPKKRREKARVPLDWRPLGVLRLGPRAGWQYALLTGDFNPVHWVKPYARAAGFRSTILHGFAQLSCATEMLVRRRFAGDIHRLAMIDVRFTRPLLLPAKPQVLIGHDAHGPGEHGIAVGDAPGGPAYMIGRFQTR